MKIENDLKKKEAIERMRILKLFPATRRDFERADRVSRSEPPFGACFWIDEKDEKRVKDFEEKYSALVYHVIRSFYNIPGEGLIYIDSYLYVSDHGEEWEADRADLRDGFPLVYAAAYRQGGEEFFEGEFGSISVKLGPAAGILRA